ncbi:MAG: PDZ domain-containing protein [Acidobacteria bacterium]|nr:PDZ domain-containing protein [Acidobacteriota bacterium]MBS1864623.1 PDZ domain-containing protein [Acidobacteriota bacterium]
MTKRTLSIAFGTAVLGISLAALPAISNQTQPKQESTAALKKEIAELKAKLAAVQEVQELNIEPMVAPEIVQGPEIDIDRQVMEIQEPEAPAAPGMKKFVMSFDGDGSSWLGVETQEVSADKAKELKLSGEHGALIGKVLSDSPAAKAGLKENDVVTEINGQRVEGTTQFRRMIHEIPAGRTVQLSVWRDGHQQTITATLGKSEERRNMMFKRVAPQSFAFRVPVMPEIPDVPTPEWNGTFLMNAKPRLGIDAEDLDGQLGSFFGAPDGEGILVRGVNADSPAEKGGLKAGDVITTFNGERIRTASELREKLSDVEAGKIVKLGVLRNKSNVNVNVELPAAEKMKEKRRISFRTNI